MARSFPGSTSESLYTGKRGRKRRQAQGYKPQSTVSSRGGKRRTLTYQGTPVSTKGIAPSKAPARAQQVRSALSRVRKAYESKPKLSSLDPHQRSVLTTVLRQGERAGATKREKLAAIETGLVESGLRNLSYGDADSQGWRQERTSQYGTGPKGARNVKASAKRFFQEIKTEGANAPTPGLAAQGAQGSAFPERYDQMEPEARRLLREASKPSKKPKPKDLKTLAKAGVQPRKRTAPKVKKKPGPWAGSQKAVLSKVPKGIRPEGRGDKRTPAENASVGGAENSDHLTTNPKSYAADLPADDAVARKIAKNLGLSSHTGTNQVVKDGYEYTLIWQDAGHYNHIHLGAEWVGKGVPPGTRLGGPSGGGGASSGGTLTSGGGGTSSSGSGDGLLGGKESPAEIRKKKLRRVQAAYGTSSSAAPSSGLSTLHRKYGKPAV